MLTGPLAEGAAWQGGSVGQLPSRPWCLSGPNVLTSWLPALEIIHLSGPFCFLIPSLSHSAIPGPALSMSRLLAGAQRKASLTSLPTSLCSDDNECLRDPCAGRGRCVNSMGSYSCFCYPGYTLATSGTTQECQGKPLPLGRAWDPTDSVGVEKDPGIQGTRSPRCRVQGVRGLWEPRPWL